MISACLVIFTILHHCGKERLPILQSWALNLEVVFSLVGNSSPACHCVQCLHIVKQNIAVGHYYFLRVLFYFLIFLNQNIDLFTLRNELS